MEREVDEDRDQKLKLHYETEVMTLQQLLKVEHQFNGHYELLKKELQFQKEISDRIWLLSQRYIILVSTGPCCKYPDIYSAPAEDVILSEFHEKLKLLDVSNCRIMRSLHSLRTSCRTFAGLCNTLDMTVESPLIVGDAFHKPLPFFIELVEDLFKSFHVYILRLKYCLHQTDPGECTGLEEYKNLLTLSEEFVEYFKVSMTYCKCLKTKKVCSKKPDRDKSLYKHNCKE